MKDALLDFGTISLAVKDTDYYGENEIDWEAIDDRSLRLNGWHRQGLAKDLCVVFVANADFNAADDFIPFIADDSSATPTVKSITGPQVSAYTGHEVYKGIAWVLPLPKKHKRYMRAGATAKSTGTLTECSLEAYIEYGADLEEAET